MGANLYLQPVLIRFLITLFTSCYLLFSVCVCNARNATRGFERSGTRANIDIASVFSELSQLEKFENGNTVKYMLYRKAAFVLAAQILRVKSGNEALKLKGIGPKIADMIDEYLETGKLSVIDKLKKRLNYDSITLFSRIYGIGLVKARELVDDGILTLEDLQNNTHKLLRQQIIGLKHLKDFEKPIPREEVKEIEKVIRESILEIDSKYRLKICGSYRREEPYCRDVDILLTHPSYTSKEAGIKKGIQKSSELIRKVINKLKDEDVVTEILSLGPVKFMGACKVTKITRRLDIRLIPYDRYYCAVLFFTGSDIFNKKMRAYASKHGYILNEYYLRPIASPGKPNLPLTITCEKDIFDYLNYTYKAPRDRSDLV